MLGAARVPPEVGHRDGSLKKHSFIIARCILSGWGTEKYGLEALKRLATPSHSGGGGTTCAPVQQDGTGSLLRFPHTTKRKRGPAQHTQTCPTDENPSDQDLIKKLIVKQDPWRQTSTANRLPTTLLSWLASSCHWAITSSSGNWEFHARCLSLPCFVSPCSELLWTAASNVFAVCFRHAPSCAPSNETPPY